MKRYTLQQLYCESGAKIQAAGTNMDVDDVYI